MAGVLETSSIGKRRRPGPCWCTFFHCRGSCMGPCTHMLGFRIPGFRGFFCRPFSGSLFWRTFFSMLWCRRCYFLADFEHGWRFRNQLHWKEMPTWPLSVHLFSLQRVLCRTMHSHVGISNSRIGLAVGPSPWSPRICASTYALKLELCELKFACSQDQQLLQLYYPLSKGLWDLYLASVFSISVLLNEVYDQFDLRIESTHSTGFFLTTTDEFRMSASSSVAALYASENMKQQRATAAARP